MSSVVDKRVLHVYRNYFPDPPGGISEAIRQIAITSRAFGIESRVFTLSAIPYPAQFVCSEATVYRSKSWWAPASCDLGGPASVRQFVALADWADVIHYHFPWPFADILHLTVRPKRPSIMTYHSDIVRQRWLNRFYAPVMDRMLCAMDAIVATSTNYLRTSLILSRPELTRKMQVIPLGIDERSYPGATEATFRAALFDIQKPFFLFIGVHRYYKGLPVLLKAARLVAAQIVIAGSGPESPALRAEAKQLDNIVFVGHISAVEKVALLKRCRALILPSYLRSEAYGMVLVEASMYAKPMISCEIGTGTSFVNVDTKTGFVVPPQDPERLAEAMNILLHDAPLALKLGQAARSRYQQLFSGEILGKSYAALYDTVIKT